MCCYTCVHRQNHIVAKHRSDVLCETREDSVVEGTGGQSALTSLSNQSLNDLGVAVAWVFPKERKKDKETERTRKNEKRKTEEEVSIVWSARGQGRDHSKGARS